LLFWCVFGMYMAGNTKHQMAVLYLVRMPLRWRDVAR
jgi:hypothetical protein